MRVLARRSLSVQFLVLVLAMVGAGAFTAYELAKMVYMAELRSQARATIDMAENVGVLVSQYKGIWVKTTPVDDPKYVGDYLERMPVTKRPEAPPVYPTMDKLSIQAAAQIQAQLPDIEVASFHSKNPALVQRELSEVTERSKARAKFRMTSDNFMNMANAPTRFELAAMEELRESAAMEYYEVKGEQLLFARKLIVQAPCLRCHESPEKAPAVVRAKYPDRGYGFREGEMAGVMSVRIPVEFGIANITRDLNVWSWSVIGGFAFIVLWVLYYVHRNIIRPVHQVWAYAEKAARFKLGDDIGRLQLDMNEHDSGNEIHRLSAAVKGLYTSINVLLKRSAAARSNVTTL